MRTCILLAFALLFGTASKAQQPIILDDDCSQDVDCVATMPILFALEDRGEIKILATLADSANPLSAPVFKIFTDYMAHPETPIGANQTNDPATEQSIKNKSNVSDWTTALIARFDPNDTRTNYPTCTAVYRRALVHAADHSVAIVATGFAPCLNQLLASKPDAESNLSGAALVKQKVKLLSVMGGQYPTGKEWNFTSDSPGWHALVTQWTKQNGFPPIYFNGFSNGLHILAGPPATTSPETNPTRYGLDLAKTKTRPMWDALSILYAARGATYNNTTYFTLSTPGTVYIDANTGLSIWDTTNNSGHFFLTNAASNEAFEAILDGTTHQGLLATEPTAHTTKK